MTRSFWEGTTEHAAALSSLKEDAQADVCVVGSGIAGLTTAYLLAQRGLEVIVLEGRDFATGETARTTAHLASAIDDRFVDLEKYFGEEGSRLAAESHAAAIDLIERHCQELEIDCQFERTDGYLFDPVEKSNVDLYAEFEAARRAGLKASWLESGPAPIASGRACIRFARQAQFHPLRYLNGLLAAARRLGVTVHTHCHVQEMEGGSKTRAKTAHGPAVIARALVVATNTPVNNRARIHLKQAAYRTYAIAVKIPLGAVPSGLYWDTLDPYHYVRVFKDGPGSETLIVGGEDHKTGQSRDEAEAHRWLERWTRQRVPNAGEVIAAWSGQVIEPADGLALIGRNPHDKNVYIATGDSGNGLTHGTIAGMIITDLIQGRTNRWAELYDPGRLTLRAVGDFLSENVNTAAQYADWITAGETRNPDGLCPGEGAVIREGLHKIAVCRDETGKLHRLSATCPHLGGIVRWNHLERTWDCPCHGSRFAADGAVLNGPSIGDLKPVSEEARPTATSRS